MIYIIMIIIVNSITSNTNVSEQYFMLNCRIRCHGNPEWVLAGLKVKHKDK